MNGPLGKSCEPVYNCIRFGELLEETLFLLDIAAQEQNSAKRKNSNETNCEKKRKKNAQKYLLRGWLLPRSPIHILSVICNEEELCNPYM